MRKNKFAGNSLMEYIVPAVIIIVTAGVLSTVLGIDKVLGQYFMSASGHGSGSLVGSTFKAGSVGDGAKGSLGNGKGAFSSFATMTNGGGVASSWSGSGATFYSGAVDQGGNGGAATQTAGGNGQDKLYPVKGQGPLFNMAKQLEDSGAPKEYVARVTDLAITTEMQGASGDTSPAALIAKQAGLNGYAQQNVGEVMNTGGGVSGLAGINQIANGTISAASNLAEYRQSGDPLMGTAISNAMQQWNKYTNAAGNGEIQCRDQGCDGMVQITEEEEMRVLKTQGAAMTDIYGNKIQQFGTKDIPGQEAFNQFFWYGSTGKEFSEQTAAEKEWDTGAAAAAAP